MPLNEAILADAIAKNVIRAIGDQMKVTPAFEEWLKAQSDGRQVVYTYPIGFGPMPMRCDMIIQPDSMRMVFYDPFGARIQEFHFHAL